MASGGDEPGGRAPHGPVSGDSHAVDDRAAAPAPGAPVPGGTSGPAVDPAIDATLLAPASAPTDPSPAALAADATLPAWAPGSVDSEALTHRRREAPRSRQAPPKIGRYLVIEPLGEGGMGVVYAAYDPQLDRKVAIKLVRPAYTETGGDEAQARLVREAQALARLRHPNVAGVYEVGAFGAEVYVAMEFVEGVTLRTWQFEHARSWREILRVYLAAGRGLAAAHHAGIVHRDFKPDNVLVTPAGEPRVLDFGLAFRAEDPSPPPIQAGAAILTTQLTMTGALLGTPAYMSPEQHQGAPADARSDIFAFCASLYEALYGVRPFAGSTVPEICDALFGGRLAEPPPFVKVPAWLRRVVLRGLRLDPAQRPRDMDALLRALAADPTRYLALGAGVLALAGVVLAFVAVLRSAEGAQSKQELGARARADFDHQRALASEAALWGLRGRSGVAHYNAWIVAAARERLEVDPEGALAALKHLDPRSVAWLAEARMIAAEAVHRGVPERTLEADGDRATALAFAPGGQLLVTGHQSGRVALRRADGALAEAVAAIDGPAAIVAVACARAGDHAGAGLRVAVITANGVLGLWEPTGAVRWLADAHPGGALTVALAPDGERVASGGVDGRLRIARWGGEVLHRFPTHRAAVQALAFGPGGDGLASGGADGSVLLWNLAADTHRVLEGLRGPVRQLAWDHPGRRLFALGDHGEARGWIVGDEVGGAAPPEDLAHLRAGGGRLVAVDLEGRRIVDVDRPAPRELRGADDAVVAIDVDDEGGRVALALASGRVELWGARPVVARPLGHIPGRVRALAWSRAGDRLAAATRSGEVYLWDLPAGARRSLRSRGVGVVDLAFTPDDRRLVSEDEDRGVRAWDLADDDPTPRVLRAPGRPDLAGLRFGDGGELLQVACVAGGCELLAIDPASGAARALLADELGIDRYALAPAGAWALTAGAWSAPTLWRREGADGPLVASPLEIPGASTEWVAAVIDGDAGRGRLAGARGGGLEVWEVEAAGGLAHLIYDDRDVQRVDVDPGGAALLLSDRAGERRLWRLHDAELHRLPACIDRVDRLEAAAGRALLIGGARDGVQSDVACLVDLASGASRRIGPGGEPWAWDGGSRLAAVVDGHELLLWDDPTPDAPEALLRWLADRTRRTIDLDRLRRAASGPPGR